MMLPIFPKNGMKLKEFGPHGGASKMLLCRSATGDGLQLPYINVEHVLGLANYITDIFYWWFCTVALVVAFALFAAKFWECDMDLRMEFCAA